MMPSTSMGSEARPIGSSISAIQASPIRATFLSVISFKGLNCCCAKLPPLTNQLSPGASAATLASVTFPADGVEAEDRLLQAETTAKLRAQTPTHIRNR